MENEKIIKPQEECFMFADECEYIESCTTCLYYEFKTLWRTFGNIPINNDDEIDTSFLHFKKGTCRFKIWKWFEDAYNVCIGDILYREV